MNTPIKFYLDNACTTHPKPDVVWKAIRSYQEIIGASPARSGHTLGKKADDIVMETRQLLAKLFGVENPKHIIFTQNSTHSLNLIIKGCLKKGDHVVTTNLEHNSTLRPLESLRRLNLITYTIVESDKDGLINPKDIEKAIKKNTKLIAVNHASNAIGVVCPIHEIGLIAKETKKLFLVDASQTAGVIPINVEKDNIDFLAFTGHKSLYGPSGIGGAYIKDSATLDPLLEGGSGNSLSPIQPGYLPEKFEAGTHNYMGIAGLNASLKDMQNERVATLARELSLTEYLMKELIKIPGVTIYGTKDISKKVPVVSFNLERYFANQLSGILDQSYGILTRPGLHCAPFVHRTLGTSPTGTVRVSLGRYNTKKQIRHLLIAIKDLAQK